MPKVPKSAKVSTTEDEREALAKFFARPLFDEEIKPEELKVVCDNHLGVSKKASIKSLQYWNNQYYQYLNLSPNSRSARS